MNVMYCNILSHVLSKGVMLSQQHTTVGTWRFLPVCQCCGNGDSGSDASPAAAAAADNDDDDDDDDGDGDGGDDDTGLY